MKNTRLLQNKIFCSGIHLIPTPLQDPSIRYKKFKEAVFIDLS